MASFAQHFVFTTQVKYFGWVLLSPPRYTRCSTHATSTAYILDKNNGLSTAILADRSIIGKRLKYKLLEIENLKASLLSTHNIMKP
jgi:hypothetical protein